MIPTSFTRNFSPILNLRVKVQGTGQVIHLEDHKWCSLKFDAKRALISYIFYVSRSELDLEITKLKSKYRVKVKRFVDKGGLTPIYAKVYVGNRFLFNVHRGVAPQILLGRPPTKPKPKPKLTKTSVKVAPFTHTRNCVYPKAKVPKNLVTIIILTYNTRDVTCNCIRSVLEKTVHPFELLVVDNASKDGTVQALKNQTFMTLIANSENIGFSKGNNLAIRRARGKYVCLLNSDIIVRTKGWLTKMVRLAESDPLIGTVGAKLLYSTGRVQHVGGGIHVNSGNPFHPYDGAPPSHPEANVDRVVPFNTGACLLITRTALKKVGLLSEEYPFGYEDVDYGLKCLEAGLTNILCHEAVLTHLWAYTQRRTKKWIPPTSLTIFRGKWVSKLPALNEKVDMNWKWPDSAKFIPNHGVGSHIAHIMLGEEVFEEEGNV